MQHLRNRWYVAMWADDLPPGELVARTICEQPMVLYRKLDGTAGAIVDQCAHRFAPLSQGRLCGEHVECPYHGLRYDARHVRLESPRHGTDYACAPHRVIRRRDAALAGVGVDRRRARRRFADPRLLPP